MPKKNPHLIANYIASIVGKIALPIFTFIAFSMASYRKQWLKSHSIEHSCKLQTPIDYAILCCKKNDVLWSLHILAIYKKCSFEF
jgi:hypothetical protein